MPDQQPEVAAQLLRRQKWQTVAMVVLYLIVGCATGYVWWQQARTHNALCTLRSDLATRVAASQEFLVRNPNGLDGLSAAALRQSIAGQERTIEALSPLNCGTVP